MISLKKGFRRKGAILSMLLASSSFALGGCSAEMQQMVGGLAGGALGGGICAAAGCGTLGTILAAGAGALIGSVIAKKLSKSEKEKRDKALASAMETGKKASWTDETKGTSGDIVPLNTFQKDGKECSEYEETYNGTSSPVTEKYTVCRGADGKIETF